MLILVAAPVQADPITEWTGYLTSDHCTVGCGTPPFGAVVLTQDGLDVDFTVTLYDSSKFVRTGAGDFMNFKFNGVDVVLADISVPALLTAATGDFTGDGGGMYHFGVYYTGQANGGGAGISDPIAFTVANATIADLTQLNNLNQIFVADIISGQTGLTGLVDVSEGEEGTPIPEPSTMLLLGLGLMSMAAVRRFKK
jgi:hypothetical protein